MRGIPNEGVDLNGVDIVKLLQCNFNLSFVGFDVDDENKRVVFFHLFHGALCVQRVDNDLVLVEARQMGNRLAGVLRRT